MENKIFELMEKMYGEMQELKSEMQGLKSEMQEAKSRLGSVEKTVLKIENNHGEKLDALFDGYKQNSEKLEEIDEKVSKHEEFIITRVK